VVVELTEHRPVADYPTLVAAVAELRLRDAKLAVDDAGAGYDRDPAKAALIEMLGRFTGQLDAWVLAEGIERMAELESLIRLRVPLAQGYLLGRPAEPWAALPDGLAGAIPDRQTAQTFEDSVVGSRSTPRRSGLGTPWPRPPTASTRWSASTTGATTWACSASSSSCTGSWPAPASRRRCGSCP
jgi:hypothetical protein